MQEKTKIASMFIFMVIMFIITTIYLILDFTMYDDTPESITVIRYDKGFSFDGRTSLYEEILFGVTLPLMGMFMLCEIFKAMDKW